MTYWDVSPAAALMPSRLERSTNSLFPWPQQTTRSFIRRYLWDGSSAPSGLKKGILSFPASKNVVIFDKCFGRASMRDQTCLCSSSDTPQERPSLHRPHKDSHHSPSCTFLEWAFIFRLRARDLGIILTSHFGRLSVDGSCLRV